MHFDLLSADEPLSLTGLMCVIHRRQLPGSSALVLIDLNQRPEPLVERFRVLLGVYDCFFRKT